MHVDSLTPFPHHSPGRQNLVQVLRGLLEPGDLLKPVDVLLDGLEPLDEVLGFTTMKTLDASTH